jgi:hypothetical protein
MTDRRSTRASVALVGLVAAFMAVPGVSHGATKPVLGGTNSRMAREDAARGIPFAKLDQALSAKVQRVVANPSIFRRLPVQVIDCDPKMYHFLLNNPEVIVNIWQVMGISKVQMVRTGATSLNASDGAVASGTVHVAYTDNDTQVVYCEGVYDGPMFPKPLRAQCVLLIKAGYVQETNGRYFVTTRCDSFIHLDNVGFELLAKTFQPMVNKSADQNFVETANFVAMVSRTSERKPTGMSKLGNRLQNVSPEVRAAFITTAQQVAIRSEKNRTIVQTEARGTPQHQLPTTVRR